MNNEIKALIEARNEAALDALQIRGGFKLTSMGPVEFKFTGYDYANQKWLEHTFVVM